MALFLTVLILSYLYHGLGVTVGYHRLLSHRSFKVPLWLEYLIVSGGYLCLEGSPIFWVTAHRLHHRYSDHAGDPHSPRDGFWHAFFGWMLKAKAADTAAISKKLCPDVWRDSIYRWLDVGHTDARALLCIFFFVAFRALIFFTLGPTALFANLIASVVIFCAPCLVNSVCHLPDHGYQNFDARDNSRNVWWVGLLALGEGWHNNHHALPHSARHGLKPDELDVSWMMISVLKALGLASEVRMPQWKHLVINQTVLVDQTAVVEEPEVIRAKSMSHFSRN
ncbi:fatty acid desaturase [soil metagenome]